VNSFLAKVKPAVQETLGLDVLDAGIAQLNSLPRKSLYRWSVSVLNGEVCLTGRLFISHPNRRTWEEVVDLCFASVQAVLKSLAEQIELKE